MIPVGNQRTLVTYLGPAPGIGDLQCERVRPGLIRSFWEPSQAELERLREGGVVELLIWTEPIPPVSLNAVTQDEAREPYEDEEGTG